MTDAELLNAMQGTAALMTDGRQWGLTLLSGYLLVAYFIGAKLTLFQICFMNIVFGLVALSHGRLMNAQEGDFYAFVDMLKEQNPELAEALGWNLGTKPVLQGRIDDILQVLVLTGAFVFMWQMLSTPQDWVTGMSCDLNRSMQHIG